ncbi:MAG: hypothetical protein IPJ88_18425 [Myxococcales bacterium]|nr:MAG: hypothetical protein IPJ88_18425 [Myxococcales bacterium]
MAPLFFYFGTERDDERFAWRMFSTTRLRACRIAVVVKDARGQKQLDLNREIHTAWQHTLARGRSEVLNKFFSRQCKKMPNATLSFYRRCNNVFGIEVLREKIDRDCQNKASGLSP